MPTDRDFRYDLRRAVQPALLPACALATGIATGHFWRVAAWGWIALALALQRPPRGPRTARCVCSRTLRRCERRRGARGRGDRRAAARSPRRFGGASRRRRDRRRGLARLPAHTPSRTPRFHLNARSVSGDRNAAGRVVIAVTLRTPAEESAFDALGLGYGVHVRVACTVDDDLAYRNPGVQPLRERLRRDGVDLACRAPACRGPLPYRRANRVSHPPSALRRKGARAEVARRGILRPDRGTSARAPARRRLATRPRDGRRIPADGSLRHILVVSGARPCSSPPRCSGPRDDSRALRRCSSPSGPRRCGPTPSRSERRRRAFARRSP